MKRNKADSLIGCCGLYCGLCSKYQSRAPSRCTGCKLGEQHSWCSIWNCCVKKHGFETCAECSEISSCAIFSRRKVAEWIPAAENLRQIKRIGLEDWLKGQRERQRLVEQLLENYNEGRSMSYYCKACARMPVESVKSAIRESKKRIRVQGVAESDVRSRAKIMKAAIGDLAATADISLD
jgi:hypothetical protein